MEEPERPPALDRLVALLKIGYTELQYWLIGLTPEGYHLHQSRNYEQLGAGEHSARHCRELLKYGEYPEPRARLGYYYATLDRFAEAVEHYRKAVVAWPHPSILLGLAQAEARVGNCEAAMEIVERVESSDKQKQFVAQIAEVRSELGAANKFMHATCETHARDGQRS